MTVPAEPAETNLPTTPPTTAVFTAAEKDLAGSTHLAHSLKPRHLSMIALGGVIGAGLLVASSSAITAAGPGVIFAYIAAGVVVILVMRMLGEMASASPETGSFSAYATRFIGPWAGLAIGWMYWWFWVVVVGIEATAAAKIITKWLPDLDQWIPALFFTLLFLAINLISVKSFGEFEFWFASIKITAIIVFLFFGVLLLIGIVPSAHESFNPADFGGFLPFGIGGVFAALLPVIFSMFGAEVATIAAGESEHPQAAVRKAVNSVVWRILLFYIGSMTIIILLVPWTEITPGISPFVTALEYTGIPGVGVAMDIIVLSALLSTLNASLYTASRMAFSLAGRGEAPRVFRRVGKRNTPYVAILASAIVGLISVILNYTVPDYVFAFLVNSTGATAIFVWIVIAVSQLRSRTLLPESVSGSGVIRMWGHPWLTWLVIVALSGLLGYMTFNPNPQTRVELYVSLTVAALSIVAGIVVQRKQRRLAS
ncbi:amino acid permease [Klugiella xanthotipulae]|uniref:Gamma-aminobutyrate:proton symporter (AAT family) n=1 Tax=Klugiella xanthotipulae TaxID=244735 RepID=A0A543I6F7_9MICO|nr:amino acid permease [Klugiella xanthotipulae]TQM66070.1 gamma-aminobutyrate:proton symporter (AAT family) [Klugiella xanthotipulae]